MAVTLMPDPLTMPAVPDVVRWAITQLGVAEDPPHSNDGEPMRRYAMHPEDPAPWCARFVRAAHIACGHPLPGSKWQIGSVATLQEALHIATAWIPIEQTRRFCVDGVGGFLSLPRPGDLILLNEHGTRDTGSVGHHVGIVERFDPQALVIHSIDGNWGDRVQRVERRLMQSDLWGLGRWPHVH